MIRFIFYFFSLLTIFTTLLVVTNQHPVYVLFYFISSIISTSCIFFLLGNSFIGALEIIIYAGSITVLFVFVIMTLNINFNYSRFINIFNYFFTNRKKIYFSIVFLYFIIISIIHLSNCNIINFYISDKNVGILLFKPYLFCLEFISMLLLSSLISSIHLINKIN